MVDEALETARRAPATARSKHRRGSTRMLVSMHSGESGSWSDGALELTTDPRSRSSSSRRRTASWPRAWRLVAMVQQMAGQLAKASETSRK